MGVVTFQIDRLNIFHRITKKHAGTLELSVLTQPSGATENQWSWRGGPHGSQSGTFTWDTWQRENSGIFLQSTVAITRILYNKPWVGALRPPPRPWFKWSDSYIELIDYNFKKSNPDYSPWFNWDCKLVSAAQS